MLILPSSCGHGVPHLVDQPTSGANDLVIAPSEVIERLAIPVFKSGKLRDNVTDLELAVSATDEAGRGPDAARFAGSSRNGQCRVYLEGVSPVTSQELFDRGFQHLDNVVHAAGGVDALLKTPNKIPVANIWGDANTPWRCVAGAIFNVQVAGYPTVGFVSSPRAGARGSEMNEVYHDLPTPLPIPDVANPSLPVRPAPAKVHANRVVLTADGRILWNGASVTASQLAANLQQTLLLADVPALELEPEPNASYDLSAKVINIIDSSGVTKFDLPETEKYRSFGNGDG